MLNFNKGRAVAKILGGKLRNEIIYIDEEVENCGGNCCDRCSKKCKRKPCCSECGVEDLRYSIGKSINLSDSKILPIPKINERSVDYIAGPSGSGKSTYAANLIKTFKKIFPEKDFYAFSRTDIQNDPAFEGTEPIQISIDESIVENPIDITTEITGGCIILFDDCNTVSDDKQKKAVDKLMADIMEVGRKLQIWIIITNHLVIPNEKKIARTIMNEMQSTTFFPKSGSTQQIRYCLKQYYGLNNKQIDEILSLNSRWITLLKNYPMCVLHERGVFIL